MAHKLNETSRKITRCRISATSCAALPNALEIGRRFVVFGGLAGGAADGLVTTGLVAGGWPARCW